MRVAFEFWYSDEGSAPKAVERDQFGVYKLMSAQLAWVAWQAASAVEREACALICEEFANDEWSHSETACRCAEAIKARSAK